MKRQSLWRGMNRDIVDYVTKFLPYQKVKSKHKHLVGSLYPLEILTQKWQSISMDFIINLSKTKYQHDSIFVMIDILTNVAHVILGNTIDDAIVVSKIFIKDIFHLHGFTKSIISDRDSKFTFEFWHTLHKEIGTYLNFRSSYHPKYDR